MDTEQTIVIVGGGVAGSSCLKILANLITNRPIVLINSSKWLKVTANVKKLGLHLEEFDIEQVCGAEHVRQWPNVRLIQDTVVSHEPIERSVQLKSGICIKYDKLILTTGAKPKTSRLIEEKCKQNNIGPYLFTLRDEHSVQMLESKLKSCRKIVILGNGGIATELAHCVQNCQKVWIVKDEMVNSAFLDAIGSQFLEHKVGLNRKAFKSEPINVHESEMDDKWQSLSCANVGSRWNIDHEMKQTQNDSERTDDDGHDEYEQDGHDDWEDDFSDHFCDNKSDNCASIESWNEELNESNDDWTSSEDNEDNSIQVDSDCVEQFKNADNDKDNNVGVGTGTGTDADDDDKCNDQAADCDEHLQSKSRLFEAALGPDWKSGIKLVGALESQAFVQLSIDEQLRLMRSARLTDVRLRTQLDESIQGSIDRATDPPIHWPVWVCVRQTNASHGTSGATQAPVDPVVQWIGADLIVCAFGVRPNVRPFTSDLLARAADGGVWVDAHLRTSLQHVFAAGDCATVLHVNQHPVHLRKQLAQQMQRWKHKDASEASGASGASEADGLLNFGLFDQPVRSARWMQMRLWSQAFQTGRFAGHSVACDLLDESPELYSCFDLFTHVTNFFGCKVVLLGKHDTRLLCAHARPEVLLRVKSGHYLIKLVVQRNRLQGAVLIGHTDLEETVENLIYSQFNLRDLKRKLLLDNFDLEDYFD